MLLGDELVLLEELFPPKSLALLGARLHEADRRARALDAYLQVLLRCLGHAERSAHRWANPAVRSFFCLAGVGNVGSVGGVDGMSGVGNVGGVVSVPSVSSAPFVPTAPTAPSVPSVPTALSHPSIPPIPPIPPIPSLPSHSLPLPLIKTPGFTETLGAAEGALQRRQLDDLRRLLAELQPAVPHVRDRGLLRRFYDVKRECQTLLLLGGAADAALRASFELAPRPVPLVPAAPVHVAAPPSPTLPVHTRTLQEQRQHLRYQEALLSDLAGALRAQKDASVALHQEVAGQNAQLQALAAQGGSAIAAFEDSSVRVQRLERETR